MREKLEAIQLLKDFSEKSLYENKNIKELLMYDGVSLWWFVEPMMCFASMYHYYSSQEIIDNVQKPESSTIKKAAVSFLLSNLERSRYCIRKILTDSGHDIHNDSNKKDILFVSYLAFVQKQKDVRLGALRELLKKKYSLHSVYINDMASCDTAKSFIRETKSVLFDAYIDKNIHKKALDAKKKFIKIWNTIKNTNDFRNALIYKEKSYYDKFYDKFDLLFSKLIYETVVHYETSKKIIEITKPRVLVIGCATTIQGKTFVAAARKLSVPSIEIQEGIVDVTSLYYRKKGESKAGNPYPDYFAVYGQSSVEALQKKCNYELTKCVIVGQPNSDAIFQYKSEWKKEALYSEFGLDPKKKTIVFTARADDAPVEKKFVITQVYNLLKNNPDLQMIVKLHPREKESHMYETVAKELGIKCPVVIRDVNIFKTLILADIVVTQYSTTVLDALILRKYVLVFNFFKDYIPERILNSKCMLDVTIPDDFENAFRKLLLDDVIQKSLDKHIEKFITGEIYKVDGKCNQRIVDLIAKIFK